jgi:hypothetical protein
MRINAMSATWASEATWTLPQVSSRKDDCLTKSTALRQPHLAILRIEEIAIGKNPGTAIPSVYYRLLLLIFFAK